MILEKDCKGEHRRGVCVSVYVCKTIKEYEMNAGVVAGGGNVVMRGGEEKRKKKKNEEKKKKIPFEISYNQH